MTVHVIFFPGLGFDNYLFLPVMGRVASDPMLEGYDFNFSYFAPQDIFSPEAAMDVYSRLQVLDGVKIILAWSAGVMLLMNILLLGREVADFYILASPSLSLMGNGSSVGFKRSVFDKMIESASASKSHFIGQFLKNVLYPGRDDGDLFEELRRRSGAFNEDYFVRNLDGMARFDAGSKMAEIVHSLVGDGGRNVAILIGRRDRVIPFLNMRYFASFFPEDCVFFSDSGHNIVFESHELISDRIRGFLNSGSYNKAL